MRREVLFLLLLLSILRGSKIFARKKFMLKLPDIHASVAEVMRQRRGDRIPTPSSSRVALEGTVGRDQDCEDPSDAREQGPVIPRSPVPQRSHTSMEVAQEKRIPRKETQCVYGRKARRRLAHPLEEARNFYDVWPANNRQDLAVLTRTNNSNDSRTGTLNGTLGSTIGPSESVFSRPQFLVDMEGGIRTQLQKLQSKYPDLAAHDCVNAPPEELLSPRKWRELASPTRTRSPPSHTPSTALVEYAANKSSNGPQFSSFCSPEDRYRCERVRVFSAAAKDFAAQFKSYRKLLLWIMNELDSFLEYSHRNVWSPDAREDFKAKTIEEISTKFQKERGDFMTKLSDASELIGELQEKVASFKSKSHNTDDIIYEKDREIEKRDKEIKEAAEGRAALLSQIERMEKELWRQRNLMEEPERVIGDLKKVISEQDEKLKRAAIVFDEFNKEKAVLKVRVERLEETLREKRKQGTGAALAKSEVVQFKRREMELLEHNAHLQARVVRAEQRIKDLTEALQLARGTGPSTPRPHWKDHEDALAISGVSSIQRVDSLVLGVRHMLENRELLLQEVSELKELIGSLPRNSNGENCDTTVPQMQAKYFIKLGLDMQVPTFLKGVGRVANLKVSRSAMQEYVRLLQLFFDNTKAGTVPMDQFVSKFLQTHQPDQSPLDAFAYSFYHALRWYSYDIVIGFTRKLVLGEVDELVYTDMQSQVRVLRARLMEITASLHSKNSNSEGASLSSSSNPTPRNAKNAPCVLPKMDCVACLVDLLPTKEDVDMKQLVVCVNRDCEGKDVDIQILFGYSNDDRCFSNFLEEFYLQYLREREELLSEFTNGVLESRVDGDGNAFPQAVADALWQCDPEIPVQCMDDLMMYLFDSTMEYLFPVVKTDTGIKHNGINGERKYACDDAVSCDLPTVIDRLQRAVVRRYCKRSNLAASFAKREKMISGKLQKGDRGGAEEGA